MGKLTKILLTLLVVAGFTLFLFAKRSYLPKDDCPSSPLQERYGCLRNEFSKVLENYGVGEGFELLTFLYEKDPNFPPVCHEYTHLIGEAAYQRYSKGERFKLTEATGYCGYGFYHGFIVSLFKDGKGKKEAADFCVWANNALSEKTNTTSLDCYHGVGHGMVDFSLEGLNDQNIQAVLGTSINLCEETGETPEQIGRCVNGVYHSIFSQEGAVDDVFDFCGNQPENYRMQCFSASSSFVMAANNDNFLKSALLTQSSIKNDYAALVIRSMAGYEAYRSVNNWGVVREDIKTCKSLSATLKEECIRGLIEGITDFGVPGEEEKGVKLLCDDSQFSQEEKDFCFDHALSYFEIYFGKEREERLCSLIGEKRCLEN